MVLVHGESYELPYGEDFEVKNGGLRLAPIFFGTFFLVYQYHNLARPEIMKSFQLSGGETGFNELLCREIKEVSYV